MAEQGDEELCPVVGCGCEDCTYCRDNHDEQTNCLCQCEYYRDDTERAKLKEMG